MNIVLILFISLVYHMLFITMRSVAREVTDVLNEDNTGQSSNTALFFSLPVNWTRGPCKAGCVSPGEPRGALLLSYLGTGYSKFMQGLQHVQGPAESWTVLTVAQPKLQTFICEGALLPSSLLGNFTASHVDASCQQA